MKTIVCLLYITIVTGCTQNTPDDINTSADHFAGVFIREYIPSIPTLKIKGKTVVQKSEDSDIYHVTGLVEGYSPMNYPVSFEHFNETLHFLGGDMNDRKNWACLEIYVGNNKMK